MFAKQQMMMNMTQLKVDDERVSARKGYVKALSEKAFDLTRCVEQLNRVIEREQTAQTDCLSVFHRKRFSLADVRGHVTALKSAHANCDHSAVLSEITALKGLMGKSVLGTQRCSQSSSARVEISVSDMLSARISAYQRENPVESPGKVA